MKAFLLLLTVWIIALTANPLPASKEPAIHGQILYGNTTGRIQVENATYTVQLLDTSITDIFPPVISSDTGPAKRFPIHYKITYDEDSVANGISFVLQATVNGPTGKLLFINNIYVSVIPSGTDRRKNVDIPVIRIDGSVVVGKKVKEPKTPHGIKRAIAEKVRMAFSTV